MELGATICTPRAPACVRCPVASLCAARAKGAVDRIPPPRRRPARRAIALACAILRRNGLILLERRPPRGLFAGLWAPPAVEIPDGADAGATLARALRRDRDIRCTVRGELASCRRILTHRTLTLRAFQAATASPPAERDALRWAAEGSLESWGVPTAFRALLGHVEDARGRRAG